MEEQRVIYHQFTGRPKEVVSDVLRSLSAYTRQDRVGPFKIGITNHPDRRFNQEYSGFYDKMVVLYQSSSINSVSQLEDELIEHNSELADNIIAGGGGNYGRPPYYLYVVVRERRN